MASPAEVRIGYAGLCYLTDFGAATPTAPTGLVTAWTTGYNDHGLVSEEGLSEAFEEDRNEVSAWGYDAPVRTQTIKKRTRFTMTFLETSARVLSLYYATALTAMTSIGTGATQALNFIQGQNTNPDVRSMGLDIIDGARRFRYIVPRCEVTDRGEIVYNGETPVGYQMTFTALLASDGTTVQRMYGGVTLPA